MLVSNISSNSISNSNYINKNLGNTNNFTSKWVLNKIVNNNPADTFKKVKLDNYKPITIVEDLGDGVVKESWTGKVKVYKSDGREYIVNVDKLYKDLKSVQLAIRNGDFSPFLY